ncbi:MAG TPA: hypothetical protein VF223_11770 [Trebonia sp.]
MAKYQARPDAPGSTTQLLWPDAQRGPWAVRIMWAPIGDRDECVGLEIRSYRDLEGDRAWPPELPTWDQHPAILTTSTLRELPFASIVADLRRERQAAHADFLDWMAAQPEYQSGADQASLRRLRSRGSGRQTAEALAEVAQVYRHAWETGQHPTRAVAGHFTISQSAAAKRVSRARQAGYLPHTTRGKPGLRRHEGAGTTEGEEPAG